MNINHLEPLLFVMFITARVNSSNCPVRGHEVIVDFTSTVGDMKKIWDSTGFSPPGPGEDSLKYLTSKDQLINIALIGSLPFKAISHVRIHWLLDLIEVKNPVGHFYDYKLLDNLLMWLRTYRMRPGFELMGNPGQLFNKMNSDPAVIKLWEEFISDLATHLVNKFGQEEVKKWRFELWNEPDSKQYNILNLTTSGYLKYSLASMKGLAVQNLSLSGPAGTFRDFDHHNISWSFLEMCNTIISIGGRCNIEAVTFHKKGEGLAEKVVTSSSEFYKMAISLYPHLKTLQFANNEADILSGWWRLEEWRGDVSYAAYVCEVICLFLAEIKLNGISLSYISNDNGFMNEKQGNFDQRTLLTRFRSDESDDSPSQFIRKPVMVVMALLSYLGPKEVPIFLRNLNSSECNPRLSVLAGSDGVDVGPGWSGAMVVAVSPVNCSDYSVTIHVPLRMKLPNTQEVKYVVYQLDNKLTNPRQVWVQGGKPAFPNHDLLTEMRKQEVMFKINK